MCVVPEKSSTSTDSNGQDVIPPPTCTNSSNCVSKEMEVLGRDGTDCISVLLELAANDDLEGFEQAIKEDKTKVYGVGAWYCRQNGKTQMVLEQRTPVMIAALYGSLGVLECILNLFDSPQDINRTCGFDGSTALHCAAAGGSTRALEAVKLLLKFGADLNLPDAMGRRPADVIATHPRLGHIQVEMETILKAVKSIRRPIHIDVPEGIESDFPLFLDEVSDAMVDGEILPIHMSSSSLSSPEARGSPRSSSPSSSSSREALNMDAMKVLAEHNEKDKEWHNNDPSLPDIKNSIYMTDEFRMFSFKIRPCSRAYSHDWTECPFAHPGENARRRDPRRYHYSCVPCPDFRKGSCRRGDACEYAHGVFECWLHPAQYRTRLCKDGLDCARRVCFFAHTTEELRPLYISSGSSIPSPRTPASSMDMATMSPPLASGSPSTLMMNSFFSSNSGHNPNQVNLSTPPMSPSSPGTWSPSNVPALHLPGGGFHASRLRAALNARDISLEVPDFDCQLVNELSCLSPRTLSTQACLNAAVSRSGKYRNMGLNEASITNHDELFAPDIVSSPRSMVHDSPRMLQMEQLRRSSQMHSQLQNQINSQVFSPMVDQMALQMQQAALETQLQSSPRIHTSTPFSLGSLGRMASLGVSDSERQNNQKLVSLSPSMVALSPSMVSAAAQASSAFAQHEKSYHNSPRDLGLGFSLSGWGSPTGKPEWGVQRDDLSKFRKVSSIGVKAEEPDVSWVHRLVKESPLDDDSINNNDSTSG